MIKIKNAETLGTLGKVVFYNNGNKIEIESYQLDGDVFEVKESKISKVMLKKMTSLDPGSEFKRAVKENLNRKDNYYMTYSEQYYKGKKVALYINAAFEVEEVIDRQDEKETCYIKAVHVSLPFEYEETTREELPYNPDFKLPEGADWYRFGENNGYDTYKIIELDAEEFGYKRRTDKGLPTKYINHLTTETVKHDYHIFRVGPYTKIEYSETRTKARELAEDISKILYTGKEISMYEMERILEKYDITKKAGR